MIFAQQKHLSLVFSVAISYFCYLSCSLFYCSSLPPLYFFLKPNLCTSLAFPWIIQFTELTNEPDTPVCSKVKALHFKQTLTLLPRNGFQNPPL